jgi:tetratricopeptide (TPR) repeat protein
MALTAFVARSFDPRDEQRIRPILSFLETFRKAGFLCEEAEAAEVESVSVKVRKMIEANDAFVGFFTKKYPVYSFGSKFGDAISLACGTLQPEKWSAPAWVLQESGYAISAGKRLIFLREEGVDIPGLQGDIEYIPFDSRNPSAVFSKLSEMINDLLANAAGREIKTVITQRPEQAEAKPEPTAPKQEEKLGSTEEQPADIIVRFIEMQGAAEKRDLSGVHDAWKAGSALVAEGKVEKIDALAWDCLYFRARYEAGAPDGLETLRRMHKENPQRREPAVAIARLLTSAKEHDEAARLFLEGARSAKGNQKAGDLLDAARALNELERYEEGIKAVEESLSIATGDVKSDAVSVLYQLLKNSGETYFAFARAEAALHENPQLGLRFELGLDYRRHSFKELGLHHFKFLHERNPSDPGSLHNLALLCADCDLPITSVSHYKKSVALGETLSAANLGFMYLDAGMADEAKGLVQEAMSVEQHDARVEACLAEISPRTQNEETKQSELLKTAGDRKDFFVSMGIALQTFVSDVDGRWTFPFGEMTLIRNGATLSGTATISKEEGLASLASLLAVPLGASQHNATRVEKYTLDGTIKGAVCKFSMTVREPGQHSFGAILGRRGTRSGFIVFAADGKSARYTELKDNKLSAPARIVKIETE